MKLVFDVDSISTPLTGIGRYTYELAKQLQMTSALTEIRYLGQRGWVDDLNQLIKPQTTAHFVQKNPILRPLARIVQQQFKKSVAAYHARHLHDHLYHAPNFIMRIFGRPSVTTIHDLSHVYFPECHPKERVRFLHRELPKTIAQSTHLIAVSEHIRQEVIAYYGVKPQHISAVHHAVANYFKPRNEHELLPVLAPFQLKPKQYLLAVATLEPRKNVERLLYAYEKLDETIKKHCPLVLVGTKGWLNHSLEQTIHMLSRKNQIKYLGYVSENELAFLYAGAAAFAFPSLYEGFCFPVLEAMASGTPVLTSNRSSLPEVAGEAAKLINPEDIDAISSGLEQVLTDNTFREKAISAGLEQARQFTWAKCALNTIQVYKKTLSTQKPSSP